MRTLHLFAGAGGGILADLLLGHTPVCAVEIEPYCQEVLLQRQRDGILPRFPIWGDVRTFDGRPWRGIVDIVAGGFPCQDISSAGKGAGIRGGRSGLWSHMRRIIKEVGPSIAFIENSPLLRKRGLSVVLRDLAGMGYHARWGVLGNGDIGPDKIGDRLWITAATQPGGWEELLRREAGFSDPPRRPPCRPSNDAHSQDWTPRLRALEHLVGEPAILGSRDGLARQVDRLNAIGNGQVPLLAATAFRLLQP